MIRSKVQRLFTAVCVTGAAGVLPLFGAAPAQASMITCQTYLHDVGYKVGPKASQACKWGESVTHAGFCYPTLISLGVKDRHASQACRLA